MAFCTYDEIKPELRFIAEALENADIWYRAYSRGVQYNAKDLEGVIHSYYPTTGTILLRASNDKKDHRTKTIRNKTIEQFIKGLKFKNLTSFYFKED